MRSLAVFIVEDEPGAAVNVQHVLHDVAPHAKIIGVASSIAEAVEWLKNSPSPDLGLFDIQLEDGLSFEIFNHLSITFPVIFTTAYDQYAINAFKVNSIDYLLKPIKQEELLFSIKKYEALNRTNLNQNILDNVFKTVTRRNTSTFLVHYKDRLIPLAASDVSFFYIEGGVVLANTFKSQKYLIDYTLEQLEEQLDRTEFFRANRQYIVNRKAIREIELYFNGRLSLILQPPTLERVLISKIRVPVFKSWITN